MKKIIVFISVLVLTLTSFTIQVYATEIENGNILAEVTPPVPLEDVKEVTVLGTLADMITNNGVNFDFSDFTGTYDDFINYVFDAIENASAGAQNFVQEQLQTVGNNLIEWIRNTFTNRTPFGGAANFGIQQFNIASQLLNEDSPTVSPDVDYLSYIDTINGSGFFWRNYTSLNYRNVPFTPYQPFTAYTYINASNGTFMYDSSTTRTLNFADLITVNIVSNDNITYSVYNVVDFVILGQVTSIANGYLIATGIKNNELDYPNVQFSTSYNQSFTLSYSGSLQNCFEYLTQKVRNVNIYVNGVPWSIVGQETPNKIIYSADNLKYQDSNTNINVNFPSGTYLDYDALKQIIEEIINNKDVLTYNDIQDVFVDYNGQKAVAVYQVNYMPDDDTINIMYPTQPNFEQFENDMSEITGNTSGVFLFTLLFNTIPPEVWGALCAGALIVLFACLIKRMLE